MRWEYIYTEREEDMDYATCKDVEGWRVSPSTIEGNSPLGKWRAFLPMNGRTEYTYPTGDALNNGRCRGVVAKLVA